MTIHSILENKPHIAGAAKCLDCAYEWVAVSPAGTVDIECPKCETLRGVYYTPIPPDESECIFTCDCKNDVFFVSPDYISCSKCGVKHSDIN